jgi:thiol:disulfide interchange protein
MNNYNIKIMKYLVLLVACSFLACKTQKEVIEESQFVTDTSTAFNFIKDASIINVIDQAIEEDKLVFVDIYTDWCLPCQVMDEEVFVDNNLGAYISNNFINFKVNAEKGYGPNIATLYGVQGYPALLFLDQNGRVLEQKNGIAFHTELKDMADRALQQDLNNKSSE